MRVLADRMQQALGERGWRYKRLAAKVGLSENFIWMVANDKSNPTAPKLAAIARELDVSADWLLGLEGGAPRTEDVSTRYGLFECRECGCTVGDESVDNGGINFCPDCGKRVER